MSSIKPSGQGDGSQKIPQFTTAEAAYTNQQLKVLNPVRATQTINAAYERATKAPWSSSGATCCGLLSFLQDPANSHAVGTFYNVEDELAA